MSTVAMSGNDIISINNTILPDLADGDCIDLTFPNEIANVKTGKGGNSVYALNESGKQSLAKLRVIRGSFTDKFLNGLLQLQLSNFSGFPLMFGEFNKKIGDGAGNITSDIYVMTGGIFNMQVEGKNNVEGDVNASIAIYSIKFSNSPRAIT